jgi:glutathione S-transferase
MTALKLFLFPGACSRVPLTALEMIGCDYETEMVNLMKGEHMQPAFRATNPRGKVPALLVDGKLLSENAAILRWLDMRFPEAKLFPKPLDDWAYAQQLSDTAWISSVWHPYVRANKMPVRWTTGDIAPVRERGVELLTPCIQQLEERLATSAWWYSEWSILDVYFYWAYTTAEEGHFDLSPYPGIARHRSAVEAMPAFQRALAREETAAADHEAAS